MEERCMEITLISARDLKDTTISSKTKAYAVAWISNDRKGRQRTPVDRYNATNPIWNHVINFTLNEADLQQGRLDLEIAIYRNAIFRDKEIGRVSIPLKEFLKPGSSRNGASASAKFVSNELRRSSGKSKGFLNISVKLAEKPEVEQQQQQPPQGVAGSYGAGKVESMTGYSTEPDRAAKAEPVTAYQGYPPPNSSSSYPPANNQYPPPPYPPANNQYPPPPYPPQAGYPPPPPYPPQAGYTPPPPYCQGYPPNQGYPPVVPTEQQMYRQNNKLGMGLGVGLVGGALGGLLIGDIIGDANYDDGGYYGGFDDGGDF